MNDVASQSVSNLQPPQDAAPVLSCFSNVRVLYVVDDVTTRFFPFWASRSVEQKDDLSKDIDESLFSEENIERTVIIIFKKIGR